MLVRVLWVPPAERELQPGATYDLPADRALAMLGAGEAELVEAPASAPKAKRKAS